MGSHVPKLADVQCHRLTFQAGDRIIVRVHGQLDRDQKKKLKRTVQRWAGNCVEIILVDLTQFDLEVVRHDQKL